MIQAFLLKEIGWRLAKTLSACVFGAIIVLSGCTAAAGGALVMAQQQPEFGVQIGLLPAPAVNQPLPSAAGVGIGMDTNVLLQQVARAAPCQLPWTILAGVATVEDSSYGARRAVGPAITLRNGQVIHAYGPAQMLIGTFATNGDHVDPPAVFVGNIEQAPPDTAHIWQPAFAYPAMARLLCANHVDRDPVAALWAYSGCVPGPGCARSDRYPLQVIALAASFSATTAATTSPSASSLLAEARTWLGVKYVFGGTTRLGIDCSAFVQKVFQAVGVQLTAPSQRQYDATIGRGMGVVTPEVGDVVFFRQTYFDPVQTITHVGIVSNVDIATGAVSLIHAPGARAPGDPPDVPLGVVREEVIAGFLSAHFAGYARVLPAAPVMPNQA